MIPILPSIEVFNLCFSTKDFREKKKAIDLLYNENNAICLTRNYIELLEKQVTNSEHFKTLIVELADSGRLKIETTPSGSSLDDEFIEIENNSSLDFLIPITVSDNPRIKTKIKSFLVSIENKNLVGKELLAFKLATKGFIQMYYHDFASDTEVTFVFSEIFKLPRQFKQVFIFDRDKTSVLREGLKNKDIKYYTLHVGGKARSHELKPYLLDMRQSLGNRVKLFYTNKKKLLHERKVIVDNLIVSADNSMENLLISEPTWEISIIYSPTKSSDWRNKCPSFFAL
jgi:hypothetical protein